MTEIDELKASLMATVDEAGQEIYRAAEDMMTYLCDYAMKLSAGDFRHVFGHEGLVDGFELSMVYVAETGKTAFGVGARLKNETDTWHSKEVTFVYDPENELSCKACRILMDSSAPQYDAMARNDYFHQTSGTAALILVDNFTDAMKANVFDTMKQYGDDMAFVSNLKEMVSMARNKAFLISIKTMLNNIIEKYNKDEDPSL